MKTRGNINKLIIRLGREPMKPLYQFFDVEWEDYADIPLQEADFGARAYNSLRSGRKQSGSLVTCNTIGDVLKLSPLQLSNYKGLGKLSIEQIISALDSIVLSQSNKFKMKFVTTNKPVVTDCIDEELAMSYDNISGFNHPEATAFAQYKSTCMLIGKEIDITRISCESKKPLYQYFNVGWEAFIGTPLREADIGARAYNSLHSGKKKDGSTAVCKTVGDVLHQVSL